VSRKLSSGSEFTTLLPRCITRDSQNLSGDWRT